MICSHCRHEPPAGSTFCNGCGAKLVTICASWRLGARPLLAYAYGGTESVLNDARRSLEIAEKLDNESSRTLAYFALGVAYLIDAQPTAAREALCQCIAITRDRRTQVALLPWALAALPEAYVALGQPTEAVATSKRRRCSGSLRPCSRSRTSCPAPRSSPPSNAPSNSSSLGGLGLPSTSV